MSDVVVVESRIAGGVVATLMSLHVQNQTGVLGAGKDTDSESKIEDRFGSRADEALVVCDIDKGQGGRAGGHLAAIGSLQQGSLVLCLSRVAIDPEGVAHQIVPEHVNGSIAAVGVDGSSHHRCIVPHLGDLALDLLDRWAVAIGTVDVDVGTATCIGVEPCLHQVDFCTDVGYLFLELKFLTSSEVQTFTGLQSKGYVEVGLDVVEGIAFLGQGLLQFDDLRTG